MCVCLHAVNSECYFVMHVQRGLAMPQLQKSSLRLRPSKKNVRTYFHCPTHESIPPSLSLNIIVAHQFEEHLLKMFKIGPPPPHPHMKSQASFVQ